MDDEWKASRLQTIINQGILVEDPDGILWMSDRMKAMIAQFNKDEEIKVLLTKKAKDDDDFETGCWSYLYMMYVGEAGATPVELGQAAAVLKGWNKGAKETQLDEWSMKLRFR